MKGSIDKNKNTIDRKNPNYFTGTNLTSYDEFKTTAKKTGSGYPEMGRSVTDDPDVMKTIREKSTKISSKIEGDSNFRVKNQDKIEDKISKIKNFDIKNVLFAHLQRKQNELIENKEMNASALISDAEGDDETDEKKKDKHELNANSAELEEMEVDEIQVVKKGMKIKVKKETKFNEAKDTPYEDIIVNKGDPEEQYHHFIHKHVEEEPPKTTVKPYNLTREMILNEILLDGIVDKEEPEEEEGAKVEEKPEEKNADANSQDDEDAQSEDQNLYLEKFKYFYRSNVIATGTISIVLTQKNMEKVTDIPNP
jgi:tellurite resistance protein